MWVSACCGNASFPCDSMTLTFLFLTNWLNCFVCCCENFVRYCIRKRRQYSSASSLSFFLSVNTITHKPLHLAWWSVARKCILTTSKSLLNIKVTGQMSTSHGFFVFFCVCMILLEPCSWPGFTKCCSGMARGQYLALSKGWHSCYCPRYRRQYCFLRVFLCGHDNSWTAALSLIFARTRNSTTSRTLLNIKVIGQRSRSRESFVRFCVHDTAATREQC